MREKNKKMKNKATLVSIVLLFLVILPMCKAEVVVSPAEIFITMEDVFIEGNTTERIIVRNDFPYDISVDAWMMHPDIISWMVANKTFIDNISWITIEPSEAVIPSNSSYPFYIYFVSLDDETRNQTLGKHWEVWAALKINSASENSSSSLKQGYLVRVFVDTPSEPSDQDGVGLDQIFYDTLVAVVIAIMVTLLFYYYRFKKRKQR